MMGMSLQLLEEETYIECDKVPCEEYYIQQLA